MSVMSLTASDDSQITDSKSRLKRDANPHHGAAVHKSNADDPI
jgi:hypothetical protein